MIDTFEIHCGITKDSAKCIVDAIDIIVHEEKNYGRKKYGDKTIREHKSSVIRKTSAFYTYGILELSILRSNVNGFYRYKLLAKVKPAIVLYPSDAYALSIDYDDYLRYKEVFEEFRERMNQFIEKYDYSIPSLDYWSVSRIDYAYQFSTSHYKYYMNLFKKSCKQEKRNTYKNSLYIIKKRYNVNFYDKTQKFIDSGKLELKNEHFIRLEMQCKQEYLKYLVDKETILSYELSELWNSLLAKRTVLFGIKRYIGIEDYFSIDESKSILYKRYCKTKAEKMIFLLNASLHNTTIRTNLGVLCEIISKGYITEKQIKRNIIPELVESGVNLLAIPANWRINYLPNPVKLIPELREYIEGQ